MKMTDDMVVGSELPEPAGGPELAEGAGGPDAEPTAAEVAEARAFGDLVEQAIAGTAGTGSAAMSADDRELLEVATLIRATHGRMELAASATRSLVDDVLRSAIGDGARVVSLSERRERRERARAPRRWVPWSITAVSSLVAAAAIAVLAVRGPQRPQGMTVSETAPVRAPIEWTSRPTDALVGAIAQQASAAAGTRIDSIFDDRLEGYRERNLSRGGRP